jgi:hypothetical protein
MEKNKKIKRMGEEGEERGFNRDSYSEKECAERFCNINIATTLGGGSGRLGVQQTLPLISMGGGLIMVGDGSRQVIGRNRGRR